MTIFHRQEEYYLSRIIGLLNTLFEIGRSIIIISSLDKTCIHDWLLHLLYEMPRVCSCKNRDFQLSVAIGRFTQGACLLKSRTRYRQDAIRFEV